MDIPRPIYRGREHPPECFVNVGSPVVEDVLSPHRLKGGFPMAETTPVAVAQESKSAMDVEAFARTMADPSQLARSVSQDLNKILQLQKNRPSAPIVDQVIKVKVKDQVMVKDEILRKWFADLAGTAPFQTLAALLPFFSQGKGDALNWLFEMNVSMARAAWFIRENIRHSIAIASDAKASHRSHGPRVSPVAACLQAWTAVLETAVKECLSPGDSKRSPYRPGSAAARGTADGRDRKLVYVLQLARTLFDQGLLDRARWLGWVAKAVDKLVHQRAATVALAADYIWDFALHRTQLLALFAALCKVHQTDNARALNSEGAHRPPTMLSPSTRQRVLALICWIALECPDALSSAGLGNTGESRGRMGGLFSHNLVEHLEAGAPVAGSRRGAALGPGEDAAFAEAWPIDGVIRTAGRVLRAVDARNEALHTLTNSAVSIESAARVESLFDALGEFPAEKVTGAVAASKCAFNDPQTWTALVRWAVKGGPVQHCVARALVACQPLLRYVASLPSARAPSSSQEWGALHDVLIECGNQMHNEDASSERGRSLLLVFAEFFRCGLLSFRFLANSVASAMGKYAESTAGRGRADHAVGARSFLLSIPLWEPDASRREALARRMIVLDSDDADGEHGTPFATQFIRACSQQWGIALTGTSLAAREEALERSLVDEMRQQTLHATVPVIHWLHKTLPFLVALEGKGFAEAIDVWKASGDTVGLIRRLAACMTQWKSVEAAAAAALDLMDQNVGSVVFDVQLQLSLVDMVSALAASAAPVVARKSLSLALSIVELCPSTQHKFSQVVQDHVVSFTSPVRADPGKVVPRPLAERRAVAASSAIDRDAVAVASETVTEILIDGGVPKDEKLEILAALCRRSISAAAAVAACLAHTDAPCAPQVAGALAAHQCVTLNEMFAGVIGPRLNLATSKQPKSGDLAFGKATVLMLQTIAEFISKIGLAHAAGTAVHKVVAHILRGVVPDDYPMATVKALASSIDFSVMELHRQVATQAKRVPQIYARTRQFLMGGDVIAVSDNAEGAISQIFGPDSVDLSQATLHMRSIACRLAVIEGGDPCPSLQLQVELARHVLRLAVISSDHSSDFGVESVCALVRTITSQVQCGIAIKAQVIELIFHFLKGKVDAFLPGRPDVKTWWNEGWVDLFCAGLGEKSTNADDGGGAKLPSKDSAPDCGAGILVPLLHQCLAGQDPALNLHITDVLYEAFTQLAQIMTRRSSQPSGSVKPAAEALFTAIKLRTSLFIAVLPTLKPSKKTLRFVPHLITLVASLGDAAVLGSTQCLRDEVVSLLVDAMTLLQIDGVADAQVMSSDIESSLRRMDRALRIRCDRALPGALERWHAVDLVTWAQPLTLKTPVCLASGKVDNCDMDCLRGRLRVAESPGATEVGTGTSTLSDGAAASTSGATAPTSTMRAPPSVVTLEPVTFTKAEAPATRGGSVDGAGVPIDWTWFGATRQQRNKDVYLEHFHRARILRANDDACASPHKRLRMTSNK